MRNHTKDRIEREREKERRRRKRTTEGRNTIAVETTKEKTIKATATATTTATATAATTTRNVGKEEREGDHARETGKEAVRCASEAHALCRIPCTEDGAGCEGVARLGLVL